MITQELDESSSVLRVAYDWAEAISSRVEELTVAAGRVGAFELPDNVTVAPLRRADGVSARRAALALAAELGRRVSTKGVDLVFAHMVPAYALMAAVFAKPVGVPVCLWYASHGLSNRLRMAHRIVDAVATASPDSYPLEGDKVAVLGHGIDASRYTAAGVPKSGPPVILAASRMTPMKQIHLAVEALGCAELRDRPDAPVLEVAGEPFHDYDRDYLRRLHELVRDLELTERVRFLGPFPATKCRERWPARTWRSRCGKRLRWTRTVSRPCWRKCRSCRTIRHTGRSLDRSRTIFMWRGTIPPPWPQKSPGCSTARNGARGSPRRCEKPSKPITD